MDLIPPPGHRTIVTLTVSPGVDVYDIPTPPGVAADVRFEPVPPPTPPPGSQPKQAAPRAGQRKPSRWERFVAWGNRPPRFLR